jgi:hypothetical protein
MQVSQTPSDLWGVFFLQIMTYDYIQIMCVMLFMCVSKNQGLHSDEVYVHTHVHGHIYMRRPRPNNI